MKEYNSKKVNTSPVGQSESEGADVDAVMKKYDRESNIRIWTGNPTDFFPGTDRSDRVSDLSCKEV